MTKAGDEERTAKQWVRSAFWVGRPQDDEAFGAAIDGRLVPALRTLPGVADAIALWPAGREDGPPDIWCQVLVFFASRDDLDRMLASPERAAMRGFVRELAGTFTGAISHIDYQAR